MDRGEHIPGHHHLWPPGNVYWFQRSVPAQFRHLFDGLPHYRDGTIRYTLRTSDLGVAKHFRDLEDAAIDQGVLAAKSDSSSARFEQALTRARRAHAGSMDEDSGIDDAEAALSAMEDTIEAAVDLPAFFRLSETQQDVELERLSIDADEFWALRQTCREPEAGQRFAYGLLEATEAFRQRLLDDGKQDSAGQGPGRVRRAAERFLSDSDLVDMALASVSRQMVSAWIAQQVNSGDRQGTVEDRLRYLGQVWRHAADSGRVSSLLANPFREHGMRVQKKRPKLARKLIEKDQVLEVLKYLRPGDDLPALIGWYTGARLGEIFALRPEDVFTHEGVLCFRFAAEGAKTDQGARVVPVHDDIRDYVELFAKDGNICSPNLKAGADAYGKRFANVLNKKATTDPTIGFASIRHTVGNLLQQQHGFETHMIEAVTGRLDGLSRDSSSALLRDYRHDYLISRKVGVVSCIEPLGYVREV